MLLPYFRSQAIGGSADEACQKVTPPPRHVTIDPGQNSPSARQLRGPLLATSFGMGGEEQSPLIGGAAAAAPEPFGREVWPSACAARPVSTFVLDKLLT